MKYLYEELPAVQVAGRKAAGRLLFGLLLLAAALVGACAGLLMVYSTDLPEVSELENYRPSAVTELYDDQGRGVGSFAIQRRVIAQYQDFPKTLRDALLSTEDKDFEKHWGIDLWRVLGAFYRDAVQHRAAQGASTLTMQLSRNLFLSPERTLTRKIQEAILAIQIERRFTKEQIFTMYCNQIYLGHGVYGFEAASEFYFNKPAKDLTYDEAAVLAGLPKSPPEYSPILHPQRSLARRNLVINSMLEDGKITAAQAAFFKSQPLVLHVSEPTNSLAPAFFEEIREYLEKKYGSDQVHRGGLRVYTTLDTDLQRTAKQAVLDGLAAYERRHGWQGHLENVLREGASLEKYQHPDWQDPVEAGGYEHALVTSVGPASATVKFGDYTAALSAQSIAWTGRRSPAQLLAPGDIVYVKVLSLSPKGRASVALEQDSGAQAALMAIDNNTGDIKAMVGGRDYDLSKFNRATQGERQVGSSFKPYVYTAAVDQIGLKPADTILDEPITFMTPSGPYSPHNYDNHYEGMITVSRALADSRNIPALKVAERVGIPTVIDYARRFGITTPLPPVLSLALGSADMTLFEQTSAYSTFPDDGVRVIPRYILKVTDYDGRVLEEDYPEVKDVISANTARVMTSLLRQVVLQGTAMRAASLPYALAGKTGTTNNFTDAWFMGFSPSITCGVWVGYDRKRSLGPREEGSLVALPIWIDFMKVAMAGRENEMFTPPSLSPATPPAGGPKQVASSTLAPAPGLAQKPGNPISAASSAGGR